MSIQDPASSTLPLPDELDHEELRNAARTPAVNDRDIDISFFSHKTRKSTQLIGNKADDKGISAKRDWLSFDLNQPIYVTSIAVYAQGYEENHEMEFNLIDAITGQKYEDKRPFGGEFFLFEPKRFIRGFGLYPERPWFKSAQIKRIEVRGIEQRDFADVIAVLSDVNQVRENVEIALNLHLERAKAASAQLEANRTTITHQENEIEEKSTELGDLNRALSERSTILDDLNKNIAIGASVEKERNERVQAITNNIESLNEQRRKLVSDIANSESTLRDLTNNIHLFPTEIAGYVKQGTSNIKMYSWLSVIPIAIIAFVTFRLFVNSEKLLNFYLVNNSVNIYEFLVSRGPYVAISSAIVGACFTFARILIAEIININRRRQELFKISIIATDISYASQDGLNLDDEQRYELRTQTKMEMLKEHLRINMGSEYSYSPGSNYLQKIRSVVHKENPAKPENTDDSKDS